MKKIVKGNDFTLRIPVKKMVDGELVKFALPACTDISVNLVSMSRRYPLEYSIDASEDNIILASVKGATMPTCKMALEVKGKLFGCDWRSNEYEQIQFVDNNAAGDTEFDADEGEQSVEMDTAIVILSPSDDLGLLIADAEKAIESVDKAAAQAADAADKAAQAADAAVQGEEARVEAEAKRNDAETLRIANEKARVTAEENRVTAEQARAAAENARVAAENNRTSAEAAREKNTQTAIKKADDAAIKADDAAVNADTAANAAKSAAESVKSGEEARVTAENARAAAETEREKEEGIRQESETDRVRAESARASAESARETAAAKVVADCDAAKERCETAAVGVEASIAAANNAAEKAEAAVGSVSEAVAGAEKVDAELSGNVLSVTNRNGETKSVNLTDSDEHISITLSTNVSGVSVANTQLNVYLNHATIPLHYTTDANGQVEFTVTKGSEYRIVFPDKAGCNPIAPVQHIAAVGSRIIEIEYTAYVEDIEHVTVNCISHDMDGNSSPIEGKIIKVVYNGKTTEYTTDTEGNVNFDAVIGKSYTVSVEAIDGMYEHYGRTSVTRTAAEDEHYYIHFSFYPYESGLWVITDDGKQYTEDEFEASGLDGSTIRLVKIASQNLSRGNGIFCINLEDIYNGNFPPRQWCPSTVQFNNIPLNGWNSTGTQYWKFAYNGLLSTETIIAEGDERNLETPAADYCYSKTVEVGGVTHQGFLPAVGQWVEAWQNKDFINWALTKKYPTDAVSFSNLTSDKWSSAQYNATVAWYFGPAPLNYGPNKPFSFLAVPFYAC